MFYIGGFSFVFGNINIFLINLTPIIVIISILRAYAHYSSIAGGENAQKHIVG